MTGYFTRRTETFQAAEPVTLSLLTGSSMITGMLRAIIFIAMIASVSASGSLDALMKASASFAVAIVQQLATAQSEQSPTVFAEKTISYARAKIGYFNALRDAVPELIAIATGKDPRSPEVDRVAELFSVGGERQEKAADEETAVLLKRFSHNPDAEKAGAEFDRTKKTEERFHHDFDWVGFTNRHQDPWFGIFWIGMRRRSAD